MGVDGLPLSRLILPFSIFLLYVMIYPEKKMTKLSRKILAFQGSPRKGGNTDILLDRIQAGTGTVGAAVEKIYLYDKKIQPCVDCRVCKKKPYRCPIPDDMVTIYPIMESADVIIFATPIYWYGPSGPMKLLMDRLRPFVANGKLKKKRAGLVLSAAEGQGACGPTEAMFQSSLAYIGMEYIGSVYGTAYDRGDMNNQPEELNRAFDWGREVFDE